MITRIQGKPYSIRKRLLFLSLLFIFLPLLFISFFGYHLYKTNIENVTVDYSKQILYPLKEQVENEFKEYELSMIPFSLNEDLQELLKIPSTEWVHSPRKVINVKESMRRSFGWRENILGFFIITDDNVIISEALNSPIDLDYPFTNEKSFNQSKEMSNYFITGPKKQYYINDHLVFSLTGPLRFIPSYQWYGALQLDIRADKILDIFSSVKVGQNGYVFAFNQEGNYTYHPNEEMIGEKVDGKIVSNVKNEEQGSFFIRNQDDFAIFDRSDYLDWTFVSIIPNNEISQGPLALRNLFIILGILYLVFISIAIWKFNNILKRPFKVVNEAMKVLAVGEFNYQIEQPKIIELQPFALEYNHTISKLKRLTETLYITKIQQHQSKIEAQKHQLLKQESEIYQKEAEIGQLEAQINPHFLYNTLSCIQGLAELEEFNEIDRVVGLMAKLFRYSLEQSNSMVTIQEELDHVNVFVEIQNIRYGDDIDVCWHIEDSILDCKINRLTIQPLVENAYFHGVENLLGKGKIKIEIIKIDEDMLQITVQDNGVGMDSEKLNEFKRFIVMNQSENVQYSRDNKRLSGMQNVIKRLLLVYGKKCEIAIDSQKNNGTSFVFRIPHVIR